MKDKWRPTMLQVLLSKENSVISSLAIERIQKHDRLNKSYYYSYESNYIDTDGKAHYYEGTVLHNANNGVFALVQKVIKAIVAQQKAEKAAE